MRPIKFITTNKYKFREIQTVLKEFNIEIEHLDREYEENHELGDCEEIARESAKELSKEIKGPFFIEDTGLYFRAYNNFPGVFPKFIMNSIGYEGILKLLEGKDRSAFFKTAIAYVESGKKPVIFTGLLDGKIGEMIKNKDKDCFAYDKIFIPEGFDDTISNHLDIKNKFSQRAKATRKLGEYISKKC